MKEQTLKGKVALITGARPRYRPRYCVSHGGARRKRGSGRSHLLKMRKHLQNDRATLFRESHT